MADQLLKKTTSLCGRCKQSVLAEVVERRASSGQRQVVVGFAAETGDEDGTVLEHAAAKLARKGCDLLVVNDVGHGRAFETEDNEVVLLASDGPVAEVPRASKDRVARAIWDVVVPRLPTR